MFGLVTRYGAEPASTGSHDGPDASSPATRATSSQPRAARMRLSGPRFLVLVGLLGIGIVVATDQIVPASSAYQAEMRVWLAARATGIVCYLLLDRPGRLRADPQPPDEPDDLEALEAALPLAREPVDLRAGLPRAPTSSACSSTRTPGSAWPGPSCPGLSATGARRSPSARSSMYALIVTGLTARYTRLLPPGLWLKLHRLALVVVVLAWLHGTMAGTDTAALATMYLVTGGLVLGAAAYRYWVARKARPTFSTSLPDANPEPRMKEAVPR